MELKSNLLSTLLLILLFNAYIYSQDTTSIVNRVLPNAYVQKYDTLINIKLNLNSDFDYIYLKGDGFQYDIRPNIVLSHKIFLSYRYISLSLGFNPWFLRDNKQINLQGKTKSFSMGMTIVSSHFLQDLQLKNTRGFYLYNTDKYVHNWIKGTDPYIQFPDFRIYTLHGSTGYKFNKNYSLKAITSQTERQIKSCGSLIPLINYDYSIVDNNSNNATVSSSQKSYNFQTDFSLGYAYNWVLSEHFLLSASVLPGILYRHSQIDTYTQGGEANNYNNFVGLKASGRAGISYSTSTFFTGAELFLLASSFRYSNLAISQSQSHAYFQVYAGFRLNAPRILKVSADEAKSWMPGFVQKLLE